MIAELLGYGGYDAADAEDAAERIYELEKRLAEPILRPEDFNDPGNYYHPRPIADLIAANPDFDWPAFLEHLGIPEQETIVVTELEYLSAVDAILAATDLETLKDYLKLQILLSTASALSEEMGQTLFDFYGTTLNGVEEREPLAERALSDVNGALGFALGQLYVDEHFPPEAKAEIEKLVARLIAATRVRIEALDWMSPETKETALAKLDAMRVKVGYPDEWRTYEGVTIEESLAETLLSANLAEAKRQFDRIDKPVDREEWHMLPQEVNAYYSPTNNEIVFPAAILQSPFFDYEADPAFNYGGIGATIGHEITHGFDQSGSQFDAEGNLVNWWTRGGPGRVRGAGSGGRRAVRRGRGAAGAERRWRPDDRREHRRHGRSADRLRRAASHARRRGRPRPDRGADPGGALLHRLRLQLGREGT